jgi:hypothetical protein
MAFLYSRIYKYPVCPVSILHHQQHLQSTISSRPQSRFSNTLSLRIQATMSFSSFQTRLDKHSVSPPPSRQLSLAYFFSALSPAVQARAAPSCAAQAKAVLSCAAKARAALSGAATARAALSCNHRPLGSGFLLFILDSCPVVAVVDGSLALFRTQLSCWPWRCEGNGGT